MLVKSPILVGTVLLGVPVALNSGKLSSYTYISKVSLL